MNNLIILSEKIQGDPNDNINELEETEEENVAIKSDENEDVNQRAIICFFLSSLSGSLFFKVSLSFLNNIIEK